MSVENTRAATPATETSEPEPATKGPVSSRRAFLGGTGTAVAVGGLLAVVPRLANGDSNAQNADAQRAVADAADHADFNPDDPLIVHVSDLSTGEISLYAGERHVVIHDRGLASRLASAIGASD